MPYFFPKIDTRVSNIEEQEEEILLNLDLFPVIKRLGKEIFGAADCTARSDNEGSVLIAHCKTNEAARYVMRSIQGKNLINIDSVRAIEKRTADDEE